ncbi:MAG: ATP-binding protein [Actinomycetota bacterium]
MDIYIFNPWWRTGEVPSSLAGRKRRALEELLPYLDLRQILILYGLRRAGKTTLMFQIIEELLKKRGVSPLHVLYFSFDEESEDIAEILKTYETEVLGERVSGGRSIYLFLDEIQKLESWPDKVKIVYDLNPNVKIFLSGSAALNLSKGGKESLAGRFFEFLIEPLDFDEYLDFKSIDIDRRRETVYETEIKRSLKDFMITGGFIEALELDDIRRRKYFREGLLERVIFRDLPESFSIRSADLLQRCMNVFAVHPGMILDYRNLGNDLGYDQRTVSDYVSYLEYAMLVRKLYNYSSNRLNSEKKMRKVYTSNTAFSFALSGESDFLALAEQFFANTLKAGFFWRSPQKDEVDLVLASEEGIVPIEIKMRSDIKARDARPLFKFMTKYGIGRGLIISANLETVFRDGNLKVEAIPYWRYWTIRRKLAERMLP